MSRFLRLIREQQRHSGESPKPAYVRPCTRGKVEWKSATNEAVVVFSRAYCPECLHLQRRSRGDICVRCGCPTTAGTRKECSRAVEGIISKRRADGRQTDRPGRVLGCHKCLRLFEVDRPPAGGVCPGCQRPPVKMRRARFAAWLKVSHKAKCRLIGLRHKAAAIIRKAQESGKSGKEVYREYLSSDLWRVIRSRVLARDLHECQACGAKAQCVHHRSYGRDVKRGDNDAELASLCNGCHTFIHFDGDRKMTLVEANRRLDDRVRSRVISSSASQLP